MTLRPSLLLRREGVALLAGVLLLGILAHLSRGTSLTDIRVENRWGTHAVQEKCLPKETNTPLSPLIDLDDGVRTEIVHHAPGFTLFDNLLVFNGTVYIVSDDQQTIPQIRLMTSTGYILVNDPVEIAKREPTSKDMQVISSQEAAKLFGRKVVAVEGVTFLVNDPSQFMTHYYHFVAEILFGIWRAYTSLDTAIASDGTTSLPPPRRFLFPHTKAGDWRDYAGLNQFIIHSAFPSVAMECQEDWTDRSEMGLPFLFKRVVFADRSAAINGKMYSPKERYSLSAFTLPGGDNWWAPVRHNVLEAIGLDTRTTSGSSSKPVITYISRQAWGRRSLRSQDHDTLVKGLRKLELEQGVEVNIVEMEKLTRREQLRLAGRSTIIMGPHGNGLTSLVWMEPTPSATVMEFFIPGGFAADYQWTTEALGMKYYGFWGSTYFTSENPPPRAFPEGFHSSEIPLDSETVVSLCRKILTESS